MSEHPHIACSACGAVNRVDPSRAASSNDGACCGKCQAPLLPAAPLSLTDQTLSQHIARTDLPLLVDFWAPWCGPCRMMAPQFEEAARLLHPHILLAKVDTQAQPQAGQRFGIQSIPTMVLFRGGQEVARRSGAMGAADIVRWVEGYRGRVA